MKRFFTILAAFLVTMAFASGAMAKKATEAPDSVTVAAAQAKQPAVTFDHKAHFALTKCETCHHTQAGLTKDSTDEVKTCTSCHLKPEKAETPGMAEMSLKKNPFHIACINCHKEQKKGPVKCAECHKK